MSRTGIFQEIHFVLYLERMKLMIFLIHVTWQRLRSPSGKFHENSAINLKSGAMELNIVTNVTWMQNA